MLLRVYNERDDECLAVSKVIYNCILQATEPLRDGASSKLSGSILATQSLCFWFFVFSQHMKEH